MTRSFLLLSTLLALTTPALAQHVPRSRPVPEGAGTLKVGGVTLKVPTGATHWHKEARFHVPRQTPQTHRPSMLQCLDQNPTSWR